MCVSLKRVHVLLSYLNVCASVRAWIHTDVSTCMSVHLCSFIDVYFYSCLCRICAVKEVEDCMLWLNSAVNLPLPSLITSLLKFDLRLSNQ